MGGDFKQPHREATMSDIIKTAKKRILIKRYLAKNGTEFAAEWPTDKLVAAAKYTKTLNLFKEYHYIRQLVAMRQMFNSGLTFVEGGQNCMTIADLINEGVVPQRLHYLDKYLSAVVAQPRNPR